MQTGYRFSSTHKLLVNFPNKRLRLLHHSQRIFRADGVAFVVGYQSQVFRFVE